MYLRLGIIAGLIALQANGQTKIIDFPIPSRGKSYKITSTSLGNAKNIGRKWAYAAAPILPSAATGNRFALIWVTCQSPFPNCQVNGQGMYLLYGTPRTTAPFQIDFDASETKILDTNPPGVCDIAAPKAVFLNGQWHVYVQGTRVCTSGAKPNNAIYLARGPSLTQLAWVTEFGTAKEIIKIELSHDEPLGSGIGEDFQWFNSQSYGGDPSWPLLATYNDWNYPKETPVPNPFPGTGSSMFGALSGDGVSTSYWFGPDDPPASNGPLYPDVILGGTADSLTLGDPGLRLGDSCYPGHTQRRPLNRLAFFERPYRFKTGKQFPPPPPGPYWLDSDSFSFSADPVWGNLQTVIATDGPNDSGFRPQFARNLYGYLDPVAGTSPKKWRTYAFYNSSIINLQDVNPCAGADFSINGYHAIDQGFAYSLVEIEEIGSGTPPPMPNFAPTVVSATPSHGTLNSDTLLITYEDRNGFGDMGVLNGLINTAVDGRQACYFAFNAQSNTLFLVNDAGEAGGPFAGSMTIPSSSGVSNSQCQISGPGTSVIKAGDRLELRLAISFSTAFGGAKTTYAAVGDMGGANSGWVPAGIWSVPVSSPSYPRLPGHTRLSAGFSETHDLEIWYQNPPASALNDPVNILINTAIDGRNACYVAAIKSTFQLHLVNDAGDAGGPFASIGLNGVPGPASAENSQCIIYSQGSFWAFGDQNTLVLHLKIQFKAPFSGRKIAYGAAYTSGGGSGWQPAQIIDIR